MSVALLYYGAYTEVNFFRFPAVDGYNYKAGKFLLFKWAIYEHDAASKDHSGFMTPPLIDSWLATAGLFGYSIC